MTTKSIVESAWAEDMGQFPFHLDPDTRKITRRLEKIKLEIKKYSVPYILQNLVGRVFANRLRDLVSIPGRVIPKTLKNGT